MALIHPASFFPSPVLDKADFGVGFFGITQTTLDSAGEYVDFIGAVYWDNVDYGSSKVISSSGGKIVVVLRSITWADGGSNFRVGIQDLDFTTSPIRGDGTYDVRGDVTGGGGLSANTANEITMGTGSKTIAQGDLVAVRCELSARGGSDSVVTQHFNADVSINFPGVTAATPTPTAQSSVPICLLVADDGTIGWIDGGTFVNADGSSTQFDSGNTPDEYAALFTPSRPLIVSGVVGHFAITATGGTYKVRVYSDPLGTPVVQAEKTLDNVRQGSNVRLSRYLLDASYSVAAGEMIALALQPQDTSSDLTIVQLLLGSSVSGRTKPWTDFGVWSKGTRSNNSGAFTEDTDIILPIGALGDIPGGTTVVSAIMSNVYKRGGLIEGGQF